jgi:hypothetical protein
MKLSINHKILVSISLWLSADALYAATDATDTLVNIDLDPALLEEVRLALPEGTVANQEYLDSQYNPNIALQTDAHMSITFLDEGAGYRNSLGYFTFESSTFDGVTFGDLDLDNSGHIGINELQAIEGIETGMVFNNVSESGGGGTLNAGDTVVLGGAAITDVNGTDYNMTGGTLFTEGTNVGFFLLQNAWTGSEVKGWDTSTDPLAMYTIDFLNPENNASATIDNVDINSRHVAMMTSLSGENELVLGFEDLVRPQGDNDFNDAVFRIRTDPVEALFADVPTSGTVISLQAAPAPDMGKGLPGGIMLALGALVFLRRQQSS